ncbi:DUF761 domain protein [Senna tora]|uniref:DUF761 domain protein n=1 Tax=Senna tora TaxID=362788 RepID=A0A834WSK2_9FABA|nr:DUF761 domain protein [Senna tora]
MDPGRPAAVVEKLWKTVRLIRFLLQNGVSKSKVMNDVQLMMKRGKHLGKTLNNAMVRHHEALTCRSRDAHVSFVSPLEYQFSCSGSPPRLSYSQHHALHYSCRDHRMVGLCRGNEETLVMGHYPMRGRVKITGPASLLSDDVVEQEYRLGVDEAAEEFIERFYRDLRLQKWLDHCC